MVKTRLGRRKPTKKQSSFALGTSRYEKTIPKQHWNAKEIYGEKKSQKES